MVFPDPQRGSTQFLGAAGHNGNLFQHGGGNSNINSRRVLLNIPVEYLPD